MSYHPRRILPPGESRKRKERESFYGAAPGGTVAKTTTTTTTTTTPTPRPLLAPRPAPAPAPAPVLAPAPARAAWKAKPAAEKGGGGGGDNRLLAGYMAHEFLTKGTLLGQRFDPARLEGAAAAPGKPGEPKRAKQAGAEPSGGAAEEEHASYADVAGILKSDGAHIPGIVNPTQLARWIHQT